LVLFEQLISPISAQGLSPSFVVGVGGLGERTLQPNELGPRRLVVLVEPIRQHQARRVGRRLQANGTQQGEQFRNSHARVPPGSEEWGVESVECHR
jgi:hypothetical protein